jgi:hypothetical protein
LNSSKNSHAHDLLAPLLLSLLRICFWIFLYFWTERCMCLMFAGAHMNGTALRVLPPDTQLEDTTVAVGFPSKVCVTQHFSSWMQVASLYLRSVPFFVLCQSSNTGIFFVGGSQSGG